MRERNRLDEQIKGVRDIEQSLSDHIELIAMGEEEGDDDVVADSEGALVKIQSSATSKRADENA